MSVMTSPKLAPFSFLVRLGRRAHLDDRGCRLGSWERYRLHGTSGREHGLALQAGYGLGPVHLEPFHDCRAGFGRYICHERQDCHGLRNLTVSTSTRPSAVRLFLDADLNVQKAELAVVVAQASRFSTVCHIWAPMYRQITLAGVETLPTGTDPAIETAYDSIRSGFEDDMAHDNHGRPIVFIGHSQGAAMLIMLLEHFVDNNPAALRRRLVLAIILGGNVVVRTGKLEGGSFQHIPLCASHDESGCVIAYNRAFLASLLRPRCSADPGQGVSLLSDQLTTHGLEVACVNPAAIGGGSGTLIPFFPSEGKEPTPWVDFEALQCQLRERGRGELAASHQVFGHWGPPALGVRDGRAGLGYHPADVNLALGNLIADSAHAEAMWSKAAGRK